MKNLLLVTCSILALGAVAPAFGADLAAQPVYKAPPPPPQVAAAIYDWSGLYIGINGGWGFSDATGGTVGGQIGYRQQMGQAVFGIEGQGNWADFSGSNVSTTFPLNTNRSTTDAFGLITGLIGYTSNNVLLYAKGGAAVMSNAYQVTSTLTGAQVASIDNTRLGAAVGAGVEVGFAPNWSVGVEYNHLFMPDANVSFATAAGGPPRGPDNGGQPTVVATDRIRQDFDLLTLRLNYKFSPPVLKY
ncbi:outer membrane protein [Bradyrhizobium archetypum]|uniref:Porin family protein n=1 Tax=Bradyrhizobium archetypum TaxID=2721160 RepID=A0A7Y4M5L9_9BRAD|nr:outer membrane beta-barrel protein [Bradyrhizobium archetypum]NOJ50250.1 porin family protein [Bradyrhizobium archetypum]